MQTQSSELSQTARLEEQTQRKKESQLTLLLTSCRYASRNGALFLTKARELHSTYYLSAGVSAAERPIVTTEQPANLAGPGVTKRGALARPLAYPVVIGSL